MKKVMMVVGVAACVTLVGCKHDEYGAHKVGNKIQPVETVEVAADVDPMSVAGTEDVPGGATTVAAPGTAGKSGATASSVGEAEVPVAMATPTKVAEDDQSVTTVTTVPTADAKGPAVKDGPANKADAPGGADAKADAGTKAGADAKDAAAGANGAAEPEFTPYVVRGGDTLGGICYRYKVKKADVLKLNPGMDPNKIFVGRTIKLPGNIEAAKATSAAATKAAGSGAKDGAKAAEPAGKREYKPYTGETKEYVVKSGDTIGGIAYSNGLSIRQFKELNGLKSDLIRVGQKVKIPLEKVKSDKPVAVAGKKPEAKAGPKVLEEKTEEIKPVADEKKPEAQKAPEAKPVEAPEAKPVEKPANAAADAAVDAAVVPAAPVDDGEYITYTVKPNDDLYSIAIKWSVTASQLKEINNLTEDTLTPGQVLKVPAAAD